MFSVHFRVLFNLHSLGEKETHNHFSDGLLIRLFSQAGNLGSFGSHVVDNRFGFDTLPTAAATQPALPFE